MMVVLQYLSGYPWLDHASHFTQVMHLWCHFETVPPYNFTIPTCKMYNVCGVAVIITLTCMYMFVIHTCTENKFLQYELIMHTLLYN